MSRRPVARFGERRLQRAFETGRILPFLVLSIASLVVGFGVLMWLVDREDFPTLGLALWWATSTVTTVGYEDVVPVQPAGRFVATGLMIVGFASLSLLTGSSHRCSSNGAWLRKRTPHLRESKSGWPRSSASSGAN